jgi:CheY-like chemotaxis protein
VIDDDPTARDLVQRALKKEGFRVELASTQADVEAEMVLLRDSDVAHLISLGGWLRGFQLASNSCAQSYNTEKALVLGRIEIMDYYLDRLETLHPRLKKTEFVSRLIASVKDLRDLAAEAAGRAPTEAEVKKMRDLANLIEGVALGPVDADGNILPAPTG